MRHKLKRVRQLNTWIHKTTNVVRSLLTSFVESGSVKTTPKRAKVLVAEFDKLVNKLLRQFSKYDNDKDVKREVIRIVKSVIYTDEAGKKLADEIVVKFKEEGRSTWFTRSYKLGTRKWDNVEEILVKLV